MIALACLILGIIGFVKGHVSVSKSKEVRGKGLYLVCTLLILPLPLSFAAGLIIGILYANDPAGLPKGAIWAADLIFGLGPIIAAIICGFIFAQPKTDVQTGGRGFEVKR